MNAFIAYLYYMFHCSHDVYQQKCSEKANDWSGKLGYDKRMGTCLTLLYQMMKITENVPHFQAITRIGAGSTAETLAPEPNSSEVATATADVKRYKSPCTDHIPELIQVAGNYVLRSKNLLLYLEYGKIIRAAEGIYCTCV
jgi:hypothetical protein